MTLRIVSVMHDTNPPVDATEGIVTPTPISLRVRDVASLWGVGERYVWQLVLNGELPSFKLGTRRLVRYAEAKAYIDRIAEEGRELRERVAQAV